MTTPVPHLVAPVDASFAIDVATGTGAGEFATTSAVGVYVNFLMDEGQDRVKASYRGNYGRLAQVKRRYDPDNVFHINQNIQPASDPAPGQSSS